ncbi:heme lyase CcmF/NrfE family subunit [Alcanivorax quisquiliarum]|uniref:Heme lyase CcmF/NrfE family subunit n=1 Tax=Alcanivorax quisquiliarum TaxID=2933565 RepID=A0ABT0E771_9GAMM|nr:heme lyase CcmF/NrfE family subunit [Alcanivorax quisquiliarum]
MTAELGHFAVWMALVLALLQSVLPLIGAWRGNIALMSTARPLAIMQLLLLTIALIALGYAFYFNDFTLAYVANHSNSALPWGYRLSAIWGGHEGSLLLWVWMLAGWGAAVAWLSKSVPATMVARVLAVMGMIGIGFLSFMLFTSNPFDRLLPWFPLDGADLNPLLQDPGLIVHPPMLYMGYVGFSVAFAFAVAGLLAGRLDPVWARWARPWTTIAWAFLTVGIALGSWWAYYELGWGGWWFWDPVENASLMPWLSGTALIHSLAVAEKRNLFRAWTVLLAILTFSLSLLGTFLVRSGILTSVHAFANDPERGTFILIFLALVAGGSLSLFALRAPKLKNNAGFRLLSRESFLLGNNLLLLTATFVVLLGTLFPLIGDALDVRISISAPYFNKFFVPLTLVLMALLSLGMISNWKSHRGDAFRRRVLPLIPASLVGGLLAAWLPGGTPWLGTLGFIMVAWVVLAHLDDMIRKARASRGSFFAGLWRLSNGYKGMVLAHCGLALLVAGIILVTHHEIERDVRMVPGDTVQVGGYDFAFVDVGPRAGPNYDAMRGEFRVTRNGRAVTTMYPEKRTYRVGGQVMTQVALRPGLIHDLYVALGEPLDMPGAWAVRVYFKPGVRWIWAGALLMSLGGVLAVIDKRYRRRPARDTTAQAVAEGSA